MSLIPDHPSDPPALAEPNVTSDASGSASAGDPKSDGRRIRQEAALGPWPSTARDSTVLRAHLNGGSE